MSCCKSSDTTVDFETEKSAAYMNQVNNAYKAFTNNITKTQKAFQELLTALDHSGQTYANMAQSSADPNKDPILEFRDGMREIKESGPFLTFNSELHEGTISVFDGPKADLDALKKASKALSDKKKKYDSLRAKCENMEKSYAKKNKPLSGDSDYKKNTEKRDTAKADYEDARDKFTKDADDLKGRINNTLHTSMNNYIHTTAVLCGYLETTLNGYRTDIRKTNSRSTEMEKLKERAVKESTTRRARLNPTTDYPNQPPAKPAFSSTTDNSAANPLNPANSSKKNSVASTKKKSTTDISSSYPKEEEPAKPLSAFLQKMPSKHLFLVELPELFFFSSRSFAVV
ncbi:hypothetical protein AGDE_05048 [Angomonas deanei]|uniref:BAR domain containing protein n=1 Tax=Angomonas deanei TaxID=59799 RepID=A0A7G2C764_9TRYP|nr:hypothetical protein AGDE_05048 [Angomonas deanei]CAD2215429.1 hypothetical protein, conserved [Angomonas deanei]|eukprot:EPY38881.1 hypothetical protein AGDE_05048 [Angomonas deanei]